MTIPGRNRVARNPGGRAAPWTVSRPSAPPPARARTVVTQRGCRSDRSPVVVRKEPPFPDPTACRHCRAVFHRKRWRRPPRLPAALVARLRWDLCPACRQAGRGQYFGRVVASGEWVEAHRDAIVRRVENVARRAAHTQPERRVLSILHDRQRLEVRTTSQKLAHRIAHELKKAFKGRTTYQWADDDGALNAVWERD